MSDTGNPYADTRDMYTVHTMFRREFGLLPRLVDSVSLEGKDQAQAPIIADHIRLLLLSLHEHHSSEDAVLWPALLARAPREIDPIVRLAEGHHAGIDDLVAEVEAVLGPWSATAAASDAEALVDVLERLAAALFEHMGLEEKLILPLVERHVFASEWQMMVRQGAASIPPEAGPILAGMLIYEGGLDVVPAEMRAATAEIAPQAYAAHCERVHGTPAPPRSTDLVIGTPFVGVGAVADRI
ncbi:MAG: hemerythrin domain-containing protein [Trebonia sp.]